MQLSGLSSWLYEDRPINDFLRLRGQINCQENGSGLKYSFYTSDMRQTNLQIKPGVVRGSGTCTTLSRTGSRFYQHTQFIKFRQLQRIFFPRCGYILWSRIPSSEYDGIKKGMFCVRNPHHFQLCLDLLHEMMQSEFSPLYFVQHNPNSYKTRIQSCTCSNVPFPSLSNLYFISQLTSTAI